MGALRGEMGALVGYTEGVAGCTGGVHWWGTLRG